MPDIPLIANVPMEQKSKMGMRFIDCVATLINDGDPPEGFGETCSTDKYGDRQPQYSEVSGYIGAAVSCRVYLEQAGLPFVKGEHVDFYVGPAAIYTACVQALTAERCPPEYHI